MIEHAVIKAAGRVMAVHRSCSRAKGANGEMTGNIHDSSWFACLPAYGPGSRAANVKQNIQRQKSLCKDKYLQLWKVKASSILNPCEHYIRGQFSHSRLLLTETGKVGQSKQKGFKLFSLSPVVQPARFCTALQASKSLSGDELIWSLPCCNQQAETDGI